MTRTPVRHRTAAMTLLDRAAPIASGAAATGMVAAFATMIAAIVLVTAIAALPSDQEHHTTSLGPAITGTLLSALIAVAIAAPPSLACAIYASELAPLPIGRWVRRGLECVSATPSIVFGLCGALVFDAVLADPPASQMPTAAQGAAAVAAERAFSEGRGLVFAGIVLAVMLFPSLAPMVCRLVEQMPNRLREAAAAAGATRWEMVRFVLLPYVRRGLWGLVLFSLARSMGDGVVVLVLLGHHKLATSSIPSNTLASRMIEDLSSGECTTTPIAAVCLIALCLVARAGGQRVLRNTIGPNDPVAAEAA